MGNSSRNDKRIMYSIHFSKSSGAKTKIEIRDNSCSNRRFIVVVVHIDLISSIRFSRWFICHADAADADALKGQQYLELDENEQLSTYLLTACTLV